MASTFDDNLEAIFEQSTDKEWRNASLFRIHDCTTLELRMGQGNNQVATELEKIPFILQNVDILDLMAFKAGQKGRGADLDEATVRSDGVQVWEFRTHDGRGELWH